MTDPVQVDVGTITQMLNEFVQKTDVLAAFVVAKQGQCIASAGDTWQLSATVVAGAAKELIAAGDNAARLMGEERCSTLLHQGESRHMHVSLAANSHLLVTVFEDQVQTGLVLHQARRVTERLADLLPVEAAELCQEDAGTASPYQQRDLDVIHLIFNVQ